MGGGADLRAAELRSGQEGGGFWFVEVLFNRFDSDFLSLRSRLMIKVSTWSQKLSHWVLVLIWALILPAAVIRIRLLPGAALSV